MRTTVPNIFFSDFKESEEQELNIQMEAVIQDLAHAAERARKLRASGKPLSYLEMREIKKDINRSLAIVNQLRTKMLGSKRYALRCRQLSACDHSLSVLYSVIGKEENSLHFASMAISALAQIPSKNKLKEDFVKIANIYAELAVTFSSHPLTYQPLFTLAHEYFSRDYNRYEKQPDLFTLKNLAELIAMLKDNATHNHMLLQFIQLLPDMALEADHSYLALYPNCSLKAQLSESRNYRYQEEFSALKAKHMSIEESYRSKHMSPEESHRKLEDQKFLRQSEEACQEAVQLLRSATLVDVQMQEDAQDQIAPGPSGQVEAALKELLEITDRRRESIALLNAFNENKQTHTVAPQRPVPPRRLLPPPPEAVKPKAAPTLFKAPAAGNAESRVPAATPAKRQVTHRIRDEAARAGRAELKTATKAIPANKPTMPSTSLMFITKLSREDAAKQGYVSEMVKVINNK